MDGENTAKVVMWVILTFSRTHLDTFHAEVISRMTAEHTFLFTSTQATYGKPSYVILPFNHGIQALITEINIQPALNYRKQILPVLPS